MQKFLHTIGNWFSNGSGSEVWFRDGIMQNIVSCSVFKCKSFLLVLDHANHPIDSLRKANWVHERKYLTCLNCNRSYSRKGAIANWFNRLLALCHYFGEFPTTKEDIDAYLIRQRENDKELRFFHIKHLFIKG